MPRANRRGVLIADPERSANPRVHQPAASGRPGPPARRWWPPCAPAATSSPPLAQRAGQAPTPSSCAPWRLTAGILPAGHGCSESTLRPPTSSPLRRDPPDPVKCRPRSDQNCHPGKPEHTAFRELASAIVLELQRSAHSPRRAAAGSTCAAGRPCFPVTRRLSPCDGHGHLLDLGSRTRVSRASWPLLAGGPCAGFTNLPGSPSWPSHRLGV